MAADSPAFEVLRRYFEGRAVFSEADLDLMRKVFVPASLRSGDFLQRAGEVARYGAFVAKGCLRSYAIDPGGKEHIVQFAPEHWWVSDTTSLADGTPSRYFIDAIEDSDLLLIDPKSHMTLVAEVPGYAASFQAGLQRHAAAKDRRIVNSLSASAEERFEEFLRTYPSIALRVPQWMLASYLGVTPETLSRLRSKRARR